MKIEKILTLERSSELFFATASLNVAFSLAAFWFILFGFWTDDPTSIVKGIGCGFLAARFGRMSAFFEMQINTASYKVLNQEDTARILNVLNNASHPEEGKKEEKKD